MKPCEAWKRVVCFGTRSGGFDGLLIQHVPVLATSTSISYWRALRAWLQGFQKKSAAASASAGECGTSELDACAVQKSRKRVQMYLTHSPLGLLGSSIERHTPGRKTVR